MIQLFPDKEALSRATADHFVASAREAIANRGRFTVALPGGHTPKPALQLLAHEPRKGQLDWSRVHVFWGDERNVPATNPDSNEGMARDALLNSVPVPASQIHPMFKEGCSSAEAAQAYGALLHTYFDQAGPTLDLIMLGMGPDGHTASLFPGAGNLDNPSWVIPAVTEVWAVRDRITLTPAAISLAREVVFELEGADKAPLVKAIIEDQADYPTSYVARHARSVTWLLDKTAASMLSKTNA